MPYLKAWGMNVTKSAPEPNLHADPHLGMTSIDADRWQARCA